MGRAVERAFLEVGVWRELSMGDCSEGRVDGRRRRGRGIGGMMKGRTFGEGREF
jgi:hypothetical protein